MTSPDPPVTPLPMGARLFHIGTPKTGTTSLQATMAGRQAELLAAGVGYISHGRDVRPALEMGLRRADQGYTQDAAWQALVQKVAGFGSARVCVSSEIMSRGRQRYANAVIHTLGGADPYVVAAARRLDHLLPSHWQQLVRTGLREDFDSYLRIVLGPANSHHVRAGFWQLYDPAVLADRWVTALGDPRRYTLVILDPGDRGLVPRVVERLLDLPDGMLDDAVTRPQNPSLGYPRTEVLRQVNELMLDRGLERAGQVQDAHRALLRELVNSPKEPEEAGSPPLPGWAHERVEEIAQSWCAWASAAEINVVGDPEHFRVAPAASEPPSAPPVTTIPIAVAARMAVALMSADSARGQRSDGAGRRGPSQPAHGRSQTTIAKASSRMLAREVVRRGCALGRRVGARLRASRARSGGRD